MFQLVGVLIGGAGALGLARWYRREAVHEADATVRFQSEHEHLHLHVDLPPNLEVQPGDTLEILQQPASDLTDGEITYGSRVRLRKASWLKRNLVMRSSMLEVKEIVEHP